MSLDTSQLECFDGLPPLYKQGAITHRTCVRNAVVAPVIDRPWPLLGREREFAALGDVLRAARGGIVVEGNAGVGKTRLLRDFAARAACRFVAATVSARPYPFGVFGELLPSNIGDAAERRRCVIDVVTAGRGVLVIDDAHLLDEDSAQVVDDIVRGERPAVVVLGIRTGETLPAPIAGLVRDDAVDVLRLESLSEASTTALVEHALGGHVERSTADRIWSRCKGNPLYLRQFLRDMARRGCFTRRGDVWFWNGDATLSPTMVDLLESSVGRQSGEVRKVLDVLAICNPVEESVVVSVAGASAVRSAAASRLITIDTTACGRVVRLAHPMLGELRRSRAGTVGLRTLRGRVANGLAMLPPCRGPSAIVRRALLVVNSDLDPDVDELLSAADAAIGIGDLSAAERISCAAVRAGGGGQARRMLSRALICGGRFDDALRVLDELIPGAGDERERLIAAMTRAAVLTHADRAADAHRELDAMRDDAMRHGLARPYGCVYAYMLAVRGCPRAAARLALDALDASGWSDESFDLVGRLAAVIALGDSGRTDRLAEVVESSRVDAVYALVDVYHLRAYQFAGDGQRATEIADALDAGPTTNTAVVSHRAFARGMAALTNGDLRAARRWLTEASAARDTVESVRLKSLVDVWLATACAMAGDAGLARNALAPVADAAEGTWLAHKTTLARAWIAAADGATSEATDLALHAAKAARRRGQFAYEVVCLQSAVQFGDTTTADRLAALATRVDGPRAAAAAAHARALHARDGDELLRVSAEYAEFGDRIAAADAAAQAAVVFRAVGRRGSVLTASHRAQALARACGADTPAQRSAEAPSVLTAKQLEIIALVARGQSNREIARHIGASVRTVEGHLLRAYRRTGATSRAELCGMVDRKPRAS